MMFDTDHISYFLSNTRQVQERMLQQVARDAALNISIITHFEILKGLAFKDAKSQLRKYNEMQAVLNILPIDEQIVAIAASAYAQLRRTGEYIGDNDILIGATAIVNHLTLITNNTRHYQRIPNIRLDNWSSP